MINTLKIYEELQETLEASAAQKIAKVIGMIYEDLQNTVTKEEFSELKDVVHELAEAQKRTETRVGELAEAQQRTERKVEELAKAQEKTEATLQQLIKAHKDTNKELGGLSTDFGYTLENASYKALPKLLKRDYGLLVKGRLKREYLKDKTGNYIEVNITGKAKQNGKELFIAGESKSKLSRKNVDDFIRKKLKRIEGVYPNIFPILVTHMISSQGIDQYVQDKGITLYYSYDF